MNPDRWQQITEAFRAALDRDAATRDAYLAELCNGDEALRVEVAAMIAAHLDAGSFGNEPLGMRAATKDSSAQGRCASCGATLISEPGIPGMCPECLLKLALHDHEPAADRFEPGRIIGDRYQVIDTLGLGGMGEVFRAFDLKLRVHVALKVVRADRAGSERARDALRREVRAAREVMSPNVCRIFDLVSADREEFVSMEFIDGITLAERLRGQRPVPLSETREIASQFLTGLEAIHRAKLVHRDLKPENIMITTAGRVVVMDFGLANMTAEEPGRTISGTPAYMAPEQARGEGVDPRADVFAAGVVLTEMLAASGELALGTREEVWRAVRESPPRLPDSPWKTVLRQALAFTPEERYSSAHELARALEGVALRLPGFDRRDPYPGLASFTADNAEYFFGREVEVETVLKKLERPRLLALIGPSGAGKSSFLRAGLATSLPESWTAIAATPGTRPFQSLAQAMAPHLAGDADAVRDLLRFEEEDTAVQLFQRLRRRHRRTLLIIDQFEELFTLNTPVVQALFARLLGRVVVEADVRVIVSLRDDFLIQCQAHDALLPAFADVTPLGLLGASSMRRALVQPALACGYRFEDETLVDEMMRDVSRERGALPLLAFAASRLWEKRDRESGLLTREAYAEIGGVAGALAQHAEMTLETIGKDRVPLVRELFRNLVTSQGTRAVRERDELLSVFDGNSAKAGTRQEAETVINALIDARLLNSYVQAGASVEGRQQIEIVHESLLTAWPRLVQWRAQEADGAQIRDQLRHAAQLWRDRGRLEDLLWSGTTYRDFVVWRERYPGPLPATEAAFARASEQRNLRGRRRRRLATATLLAAAAVVSLTTFVLWRQSESSRQRAEAETLRSEAGKLVAMAQRELDRYPTAALAYAMKSLELADTEAGRLLAVSILQRGPVARIARVSADQGPGHMVGDSIDFGPNGQWVAWAGMDRVEVVERSGGTRLVLGDYIRAGGRTINARFSPDGGSLMANRNGEIRVWSIPDGHERYRGQTDPGVLSIVRPGQSGFMTLTSTQNHALAQWWPFTSGQPQPIGSFEVRRPFAATYDALAYSVENAIHVRSLRDRNARPTSIVAPGTLPMTLALSPDGSEVATADATRDIRIWSVSTPPLGLKRVIQAPAAVVGLTYGSSGQSLIAWSFEHGYPTFAVFDLAGPENTNPTLLVKGDTNNAGGAALDPTANWMATTHGSEVAFWPLASHRNRVLRLDVPAAHVYFSSDGKRLLTALVDGTVQDRPLHAGQTRVLRKTSRDDSAPVFGMAVAPDGRQLAVSGLGEIVEVLDLATGSWRQVRGVRPVPFMGRAAFSEDGRLLAAGVGAGLPGTKRLFVWDLESGEMKTFGPFTATGERREGGIASVEFVGNHTVLASVVGHGIVAVDLTTGANRLVAAKVAGEMAFTRDGRLGFVVQERESARRTGAELFRLQADGEAQPVLSHGKVVTAVTLDPTEQWVASGSFDGTIRIGPVSGGDPHLLLGQEGGGAVYSLAFSPDGQWIAASGEGFRLYLCTVPDLTKPPIHRLAHDALLTLFRTHTNLAAIPDASAPNGYRLEVGPFPGWAHLPQW